MFFWYNKCVIDVNIYLIFYSQGGCCMKKYNSNIEKGISVLDLDKETANLLKKNNINKVEDVWILNRKKLKEMGLSDNEIKQVVIKLQLLGLDLNKKMYS